jgi:CRISPR-associated endoribonuclease Cas6
LRGGVFIIYNELTITFIFPQNIELKFCNEYLSKVIAKAMTFNETLKIKHEENTFKLYIFSLPAPLEPDRIYRSGRAYVFRIRSFDLHFLLSVKSSICNENCGIKVMAAHISPKPYRRISEITSLTPVVCTLNSKYWICGNGILILRDKIFSNACRKTKLVFPEFKEPDENFIDGIIQLNQKNIVVKYKNASILGAKVKILIKNDENSQKLAYTIMGAGMLEKNSIGLGFCIAK